MKTGGSGALVRSFLVLPLAWGLFGCAIPGEATYEPLHLGVQHAFQWSGNLGPRPGESMLARREGEAAPGAPLPEGDRASMVRIEIRLVELPRRVAAELVGNASGVRVATISSAGVSDLLRRMGRDGRVRVLASPSVTCFEGQRASAAVVTQVAYISGYAFVGNEHAQVADPVVETTDEGIRLDVLPRVSLERPQSVDLTFEMLRREIARPWIQLRADVGDLLREGPVELPVVLEQHLEASASAREGECLLISGLPSSEPDAVLLAFVTPHATALSEDPASREF